uniref:Anion exchange protein n=1 Tax=Athene cunicularia TaxID=194338 RepID=A0A663NAH6_ATHCN
MGLMGPDVCRWLKFEEDVEDGGERWSKPYVATLSLHSLFELRSCILNGTVLLDICANSIEEIAGTMGTASLWEQPSSVCCGALHSGIPESSGLEKPLKLLQPKHEPPPDPSQLPQIPQRWLSPTLQPPQGSRGLPPALGSPFQRPTAPSAQKSFLRASLTLPCFAAAGAALRSLLHVFFHKNSLIFIVPSSRLFGGLIQDVKRKAPWFWSDFRDGLRLQCLASFLFLYYACMSLVITFGGLLGEATDGHISAMESLLGASMTGVVYSLFAGQPLAIIGSTGSTLVFENLLYKFCKEYALSYLSLRACIGLWTAFFCIVLVATNASSLECYITRFTNEAFTSLICLIFIYKALEKLSQLLEIYRVHMHSKLDLLTTNKWVFPPKTRLRLGRSSGLHLRRHPLTPLLASLLPKFKTIHYFPTRVSRRWWPAAVPTLMTMLRCDALLQPTRDDRGWFINPIGPNPWWTVLAALIPALLCTILIFMDQQITSISVDGKEQRLKKGCGYHLDLFILAVMFGVCSVMGLPWFVASTILSITHVNSLKVESECSAPGEQPKFLGIREQRVTGLMIFVLMGCSVFFTSLLKFIPMPVLYGVFLYMGVSSLRGIQFFDRLKLFWTPEKHQPDFIYLRHVPLRKVHLFTVIQLICLVLLWAIRVSGLTASSILFVKVLALVFVRKMMEFCFSKQELRFLDDIVPEGELDDAKNEHEGEEVRLAGCSGLDITLGL